MVYDWCPSKKGKHRLLCGCCVGTVLLSQAQEQTPQNLHWTWPPGLREPKVLLSGSIMIPKHPPTPPTHQGAAYTDANAEASLAQGKKNSST
jgi:hypothetical protein